MGEQSNKYYGNQRWRDARKHYLAAHPLCVMCVKFNHIEVATVVDHIVPHKGDYELFWDQDNWQALCKPHHDQTKKQYEGRGFSSETDKDGWPTDPRHPVNRI